QDVDRGTVAARDCSVVEGNTGLAGQAGLGELQEVLVLVIDRVRDIGGQRQDARTAVCRDGTPAVEHDVELPCCQPGQVEGWTGKAVDQCRAGDVHHRRVPEDPEVALGNGRGTGRIGDGNREARARRWHVDGLAVSASKVGGVDHRGIAGGYREVQVV